MVNGVRLKRTTLVRRYSMPEAAADGITRLLSQKGDVTDGVARAAPSEKGIAKLLASAKLRASATSLTTERLQTIRRELTAGGQAARLVVVPKRVWRTIALETEGAAAAPLPVLTPAGESTSIKLSDAETLFPADEVRRLKLTVLTSAEPKERITAIRRLVLAPATAREKGCVLLSALSDDDPQVKVEAIEALVPLGLNPDIAREARRLVSGMDKQKVAAASRIRELAGGATEGEVSVMLTLAQSSLRAEMPAEARRQLILSVGEAAPVLAKEPAQLAGAVSLLAEQLTERPNELRRPVLRVLSALGSEEPAGTVETLEAEAGRVPDAEARRLLLGAFNILQVPPSSRRHLAEAMAQQLLSAPEPETQCLGMANCLCRWGGPAAEVLLETLSSAPKQQKTFMLRILDNIVSGPDCPARTKRATAERFLAMLKTEPPTVRAVLLESQIFSAPQLPPSLRSSVAEELIGHVQEFGGSRLLAVIERTIAGLGSHAIGPLVERMKEGVRDLERVSAARVLGQIVGALHGRGPKQSKLAVDVLMACVRQLDGKFPDRDVLAASIGQMCTSSAMPSDTVRRVAKGLRARVGKEPYSFGLLEGLGRLASSPNVALETRVEVAESLLRLLDVDLPEMRSKRYTGRQQTVFVAGNEAAAYTDMIPILLDGLGNVCTHAGSAALHQRLVEALLQKWRQASTWRLVWGPANTLKLAEVLGAIALAPNAGRETREEVARALATGADVVPVLRILGKLFATDGASAEMGKLAAGVGEHLLKRMAPRSGDRIDLDTAVTSCLAAIAGRKNLGPKDKAEPLRRGIAQVLFKALRNGAPGAKRALRTLAQSPGVGQKVTSEIESRLADS